MPVPPGASFRCSLMACRWASRPSPDLPLGRSERFPLSTGGKWKLVAEFTEAGRSPEGVPPSRCQAYHRQAGPFDPQRRLHFQFDGVKGRI